MRWFTMDAPAGWPHAIGRSMTIAVVGFVVLQAKEYFDAGMLDTPATAVDAALIAGGVFILNAVLIGGKAGNRTVSSR